MQLTQTDIENAVLALIDNSNLAQGVTGVVCLAGQRPVNSQAEDIVIIFTDGLPGQTQVGTLTLNIYIPDVDPWDNGIFIKDRQRVAEIENLCRQWLTNINAATHNHCFRFYPKMTIATMAEPEINQHFVSVKLGYEYYDGE